MIGFCSAPATDAIEGAQTKCSHAMRIEHFYIAPAFQCRGLGGAVLARLFGEAPDSVELFRVGALRGSDANRFYRHHGFVQVSADAWDIGYERPRLLGAA